ncbi:MAG: tRNA lysidine(34) synthetase TilS [Gammaproteobacteria bacterium]|nr:tRNA lysidine(34) synthetase TilS [Gammaproteobacteria bacterium]
MTFSPDHLLDQLQSLTAGKDCRRWVIAYSGGIDSTVLLHALLESADERPIRAIHVDHGLHEDSAAWSDHCRRNAERLGVPFHRIRVAVEKDAGGGIEAAARDARYRALLSVIAEGDCLLSGHHEDDQAETLLLNLLRGSGPAGLAGIGAVQSFGKGLLLRPMLGVNGGEIADYARGHGLQWIDDPSNLDTRFDRNFIRQEILPRLTSRWPAAARSLRRSAELVADASALLNDLADIDIAACGSLTRLSIPSLLGLPAARQRNVLRRAVRRSGLPPIPATRLDQALTELVTARGDAQPLVAWDGGTLRRYRGELFVLETSGDTPSDTVTLFPGQPPHRLGAGLGTIALVAGEHRGIAPNVARAGLELRFRAGGERIRIAAGAPTKTLKNLMQEAGVLPWMREKMPLFFAGTELVAVGDLWFSADHAAMPGIIINWQNRPEIR